MNKDQNDEWFDQIIDQWQAVADGRLIHVQDDRWTWRAAFPVVATFVIDGWEFVIRGHDEEYMIPSNGAADWITARLIRFERGRPVYTQSGRCIECGAYVGAGYVPLTTPSGRKFDARFRDSCDCRHSGAGVEGAGISYRLGEAAKLLASYVTELGEAEELKQAVYAWLDKEDGSVRELKRVGRNLRK